MLVLRWMTLEGNDASHNVYQLYHHELVLLD
jgi:hypothetical protein